MPADFSRDGAHAILAWRISEGDVVTEKTQSAAVLRVYVTVSKQLSALPRSFDTKTRQAVCTVKCKNVMWQSYHCEAFLE